jgi:hypothetical protein
MGLREGKRPGQRDRAGDKMVEVEDVGAAVGRQGKAQETPRERMGLGKRDPESREQGQGG